MADQIDVDQIENAARAALEKSNADRIAAVRELGNASRLRDEAHAALSAATADHVAAWDRAVSLGWTTADLRRFGLDEPENKALTRSRPKRKRGAATSAPTTASSAAATGDQAHGFGGQHGVEHAPV